MADSTDRLKRVQKLPEPEVAEEGEDGDGPHDERDMPSFRDIFWIVEYG
jgi:hypothetical protein